uniref:Pheromone biosynthesis activating neuropeptide isoform 1 n=1 Tax=Phlebotomus papatasi TaxID=29031 RepID=A0A0A7H770_PHLPP|nr:pheromone biosynthesis activating neuropeptide isoform 1 [Phlebotomus papatasi]
MNKLIYFVLLCVPICLNQVPPVACAYNPDILGSLENVRKAYPSLNLKNMLNLIEANNEFLKKEDLLDDKRAKRYTGVIPEVLVSNGVREDHEGLKDSENVRKFGLDAVQESPWLIFLLTGTDFPENPTEAHILQFLNFHPEKSNKYMTPRLGRDASGDNGSDSQRTRPPFAPRLGKKSLPFSPRLGRQMLSNFGDQ